MNQPDVECCDLVSTHEEILDRVRQQMPDEDTLYNLTELFHIFGDSTRMRILYVLFASEMCVCDIAALLGITQSAISHQLRLLKSMRLVKSRQEHLDIIYALRTRDLANATRALLIHLQNIKASTLNVCRNMCSQY